MATKRIVLTGTPIQNDLQELFAIVDFVAPGFLGTLYEFRQLFEGPIARSREPNATLHDLRQGKSSSLKLQETLSLIMIRRSQSDVINSQLPKKRECILLCYLNESQRLIYKEEVRKLFDSIDRAPPTKSYIEAGSTHDIENDESDECVENTRIANAASVLSSLLRLRQTCDYIDLGPSVSRETLLDCSSKLHTIDVFLLKLQSMCLGEKVVIVSNFTSTLDFVQQLMDYRKWSYLRLDGSVPVTQRQNLVDRFNMPIQRNVNGETFGTFIFLLSAQAGGVGINLIGASRLILMDPSWNPATDKQAMARIWREGQKRPVFIYRMLSPGTIECSMFRRQLRKLELEGVLAASSSTSIEKDETATDTPVDDLNAFTVRTLGELVYPEEFGDADDERSSDGCDAVVDSTLAELGPTCIRYAPVM